MHGGQNGIWAKNRTQDGSPENDPALIGQCRHSFNFWKAKATAEVSCLLFIADWRKYYPILLRFVEFWRSAVYFISDFIYFDNWPEFPSLQNFVPRVFYPSFVCKRPWVRGWPLQRLAVFLSNICHVFYFMCIQIAESNSPLFKHPNRKGKI